MLLRYSTRAALAAALSLLGTVVACDTGFVSMGGDDPAPTPKACGDDDCGTAPSQPAMCPESSMGIFECRPDDSGRACVWRPVCYAVAGCTESECGPPPGGLAMCLDGMLHDFVCDYDASNQCAWVLPPDCVP